MNNYAANLFPIDDGMCHYQRCQDNMTCQCDKLCYYYRDCCEEVMSDIAAASYHEPEFISNEHLQCRPFSGFYATPYRAVSNCPWYIGYWVVSSCPSTTVEALKKKCENDEALIVDIAVSYIRPVQDVYGNLFKNIYCARCHGVSERETLFWEVEQICNDCQENLLLSSHHRVNRSSSQCFLILGDPLRTTPSSNFTAVIKPRLRQCNHTIIRSCPQKSDSEDIAMCSGQKGFSSPVYVNNTLFRNIFCAKCNGLTSLQNWSCELPRSSCQWVHILSMEDGISLVDPLCSLLQCHRPSKLCSRNEGLRHYLVLKINRQYKCSFLDTRAENCFLDVFLLASERPYFQKKSKLAPIWYRDMKRDEIFSLFQISENTTQQWLLTFERRLHEVSQQLVSNKRSCYLEFIDFIEVCSGQSDEKLGECPGTITEIDGDGILDDEYVIIEEISANASVKMNLTWYMVKTRFFIDFNRSSPIKRTIICLQPDKNMRSCALKTFGEICSAVAVTSHVATFTIYALLKPFRNTFGCSLMCFILSITIAVCLMQFVSGNISQDGKFCKAIAISSHLFWLSSFSWMTVLAWDLCATLSPSKIRLKNAFSFRRFALYCSLGWGMPLFVILICILLSLVNAGRVFEIYGLVKDGTCWLKDPLTILYAVGVPLLTCIVINLFLFAVITRNLYQHHKNSKHLRSMEAAQIKNSIIEVSVFVKVRVYFQIHLSSSIPCIGNFHFKTPRARVAVMFEFCFWKVPRKCPYS